MITLPAKCVMLNEWPDVAVGLISWFTHAEFPRAPLAKEAADKINIDVVDASSGAGSSAVVVSINMFLADRDPTWFTNFATLTAAIARNSVGKWPRECDMALKYEKVMDGYTAVVTVIATQVRILNPVGEIILSQ